MVHRFGLRRQKWQKTGENRPSHLPRYFHDGSQARTERALDASFVNVLERHRHDNVIRPGVDGPRSFVILRGPFLSLGPGVGGLCQPSHKPRVLGRSEALMEHLNHAPRIAQE